ncbi:unnamed protein product [Acanthoscelides obtectus]|uniref:Gustatory receptor n=1 Tax=Acanthoscelides obtectus TaxID=200917 RepID=A0A9P0K5P2_ACAOB|nr:unnamed protein product [Acanthoscelides obtectus]CAK1643723.1 Gustatory receptor for sugar taste 43a [Acanthoscelides obtectus]
MMLVSVLASDLGGSMQSVRMRDKKGKILTSSDISIVIVNVIFGIAAMPCRMKRYSKILKITGMLDTLNLHLETSDFPRFFFNMKMVNKYVDAPYIFERPNGNCMTILNTTFLEERMFQLLNVHKHILHGVNIVNNSFCNGLVLMMFSCLIHLIITPYFLLAEVVKPDCDVVFTFLQVVWIATHIARLLIIIEPCQSCSLEGQRTIALLCDLLGKYDITDNTRKIVEVFITQASQQPVKFSCFHLFNLDRSVLTALSGSIATYIVILFQFSTN